MSRVRVNLNRDWRFLRQDIAGAEAIDFDDRNWQRIGLPHTFDLPYFRTPEFYVGVGWYRNRFVLTPSPATPGEGWGEGNSSIENPKSKIQNVKTLTPALSRSTGRGGKACVFLEFAGVFQVAEAFVNGRRAGEHRGGYTGFSFDITDLIRDGENLLAVRVDNNWSPQISPRAGEHIFSGGIYRDVYLVITDALHVTWHGTVVTTPQVSRESATVNVRTEVANRCESEKACSITTTILDPDGKLVLEMRDQRRIPAGQVVELDQTSQSIPLPRLWHPDHPYRYLVHTQIYDGDDLVDECQSPFGIRWFEWTADRGFFLNGEHLYLRGANVHQDHSGWGIAITQAACERDVRLIKEAGFNFVRGAHYPHHTAFADACDRIGLIFWSENCFWGKGGFGPEGYWNASAYPVNPEDFEPFEQHCRQTLTEMIQTHRNHPSIMAWSMTNEAFFTYNLDRARNLMRDLVTLSHKLDPTRPAAIGGAQRGDVDKLGDIAGYNGDGARLFLDPGVPNMVSEYGAITKPHDVYEPFFGDLQSERYPWRAGEAIWCGFDYGSIAGRQGLKGILRHDRLPKQSWHWYRDHSFSPSPGTPGEGWGEGPPERLHLSADKTTINGTDATDDAQIIVSICDNKGNTIAASPPVTLTIERGPGEFPTGRSITFDASTDIPILAGHAAIAFRAYESGETLIRATSPGLAHATLTITTLGEPRFVECVTPIVSPRPYIPPPESEAAKIAMRNAVNVALNRPCRASSEKPDHHSRAANDGDPLSCWFANDASTPVWWLVDLEGFYQLSSLKLTFPAQGNWRFIVEFSQDAARWDVAIDRSASTRTDAVRNEIAPPGSVARYVRVSIISPEKEAGLAEVEVFGIISVR